MSLLGRQLGRPTVLPRVLSPAVPRQQVRHSSVLNALGSSVAVTAESLSSLHASGLPWYIILPLVATSLNFTVRLPMRYMLRYYRLKKSDLQPLRVAWMRSAALRNPSHSASNVVSSWAGSSREAIRVGKDFGLTPWKTWVPLLAPMIPFVLVSEVVRRLAGSPMTWLGTKLGLDRFLDILEPGTSALTDSTLAEGGILWFTNLMAADPYGGLPLFCSLTLIWSTWSRIGTKRLRELLSVDSRDMFVTQRLTNAVGRVLLAIPLFPLLFMNLPSAVFLYWAPTFLFNEVNTILLKKWLPDRKPRYGSNLIPSKNRYVSIEGYEVPKEKKGGERSQSRKARS